jgi:hypothetical protein
MAVAGAAQLLSACVAQISSECLSSEGISTIGYLRRDMHANVFVFSQLLARSPERYLEFVRVPSFTVGI